MNRTALMEALKKHGWQAKLLFDGRGPLLHVTGAVTGKRFQFTQHVPVRLLDDHGPFLESLYADLLIEAGSQPADPSQKDNPCIS